MNLNINDRVTVNAKYWRRWNRNYRQPQVGTIRHLYPLMVEFDDMPNVLVEVKAKLVKVIGAKND